jgi:predicted amidohydrolase
MRVAAVQLQGSADREGNLARAGDLVSEAARAGAEVVVLPELFSVYGDPEVLRASAEPLGGPLSRWAGELAGRLGIWLVAGSFIEAAGGGGRFNTSVLHSPTGTVEAVYRKIHRFDVDVPGVTVLESEVVSAGEEVVLASVGGAGSGAVPVGMAICYDLRFPELFRILALRGALLLVVPSAFAAVTGKAHWEVLVRARAIENQAFVIAADQVGPIGPGFEAHGHSMIVDPWGRVLAEKTGGEGVVLAEIDLGEQAEIRSRLPSLAHRRPDAYRWPAGESGSR